MPASACSAGSEVFLIPVPAQVPFRDWNRPYAVLVGFWALGRQPRSLLMTQESASHWAPASQPPVLATLRTMSTTGPLWPAAGRKPETAEVMAEKTLLTFSLIAVHT